jgi:hypothetical protein
MRHILSRSVLTVAAASSILAVTGGYANADSDAQGGASHSPGVLSGNSVEAPVDVPLNACGNSVNVVGAGNAALGNTCANESHSHHAAAGTSAAHSPATEGSPGVGAGNAVKVPVDVPVEMCGNTVDPGGLLNAAFGNSCTNDGTEASSVSGTHTETDPVTSTDTDSVHTDPLVGVRTLPASPQRAVTHTAPAVDGVDQPYLAETGASGAGVGTAGAAGAALLLGGAMLYRRGRGPRAAHVTQGGYGTRSPGGTSAASLDRIRRTYS